MRNRLWYYALLFFLVAGLVAAGLTGARRYEIEQNDRTVELALDYPDATRLADEVNSTPAAVVARLRRAGVTTLAVGEYTVQDYLEGGNVVAVSGRDILANQALGQRVAEPFASVPGLPGFKTRAVYLVARNTSTEKRFGDALKARLAGQGVRRLKVAGQTVWEVNHSLDWLSSINLGLGPDQVGLAVRLGMHVAPRWLNYAGVTPGKLKTYFAQVPPGRASVAIFAGHEVLGYPVAINQTAAELQRSGITFGLVEFADQHGEEDLAKAVGYRVVRVHSITPREMEKIVPSAAVARDLRGVRERGIRVIYLRPFLMPEQLRSNLVRPGGALAFNLEYVRQLKEGLAREGYTLGRAVPAAPLSGSWPLLIVLAAGTMAAMLLLLRRFVPVDDGVEVLIMLLGTAGAGVLALKGYSLVVRQLFALAAGVALSSFGVLAARAIVRPQEKPLGIGVSMGRSLVAFAIASAFSLAGAAFVIGLLGETRFMLHIAQFSGVKFLHAFPVLLVWFALSREALRRKPGHVAKPGWVGIWADLREILSGPVTWEQAVISLLVLAVGAFYLLRTGTYTSVPVPGWERAARDWLERVLVIRPRTKEFLIGHPALILAFVLELRHSRLPVWVLFLVGVIGQLSMVDTFSHVHTPLEVSAIRTALGLGFGAAAGLVVAGLWFLGEGVWRSRHSSGPQAADAREDA